MKIPHITIHTSKQSECVNFYSRYTGLSVVRELPGIVFLGNGKDGETLIELIRSEESYTGKGISIGFACRDLDAQREKMVADGLAATPVISPNPHVRFFFVTDPSGLTVQFIEE